MNIQSTYTLTSPVDANRFLRRWTSLSRVVFCATILLCDVAAIVCMSLLTGIGYHFLVYREIGNVLSFFEVGLLSAAIFAIANQFRGEYRLSNFFTFKPHWRRSLHLWNVTFICLLAFGFLAQISVVYSRGWFILYYGSTVCVVLLLRYLFVQATVHGSRTGMLSAQRILLFGSGRHVNEFVTRYEPKSFGVNIVGCHFLTPMASGSPADVRRHILTNDLEQVIASVRLLEPDAIFLVMPWSAQETINACVEALLKLPAEIHLGAEHILDQFEHVELSRFGSMVSLQLTRMPLSRFEAHPEADIRPAIRLCRIAAADSGPAGCGVADQAGQQGAGFLSSASVWIQSKALPHHQVQNHANTRGRGGHPSGQGE